jgi:hypothetical protein
MMLSLRRTLVLLEILQHQFQNFPIPNFKMKRVLNFEVSDTTGDAKRSAAPNKNISTL